MLETIVKTRIMIHISSNRILSESQFGFRESLNTETAVITLVNLIENAIENNLVAIGLFLDIRRAFDTVNHRILLDVLHNTGFRGIVYDWFVSYLASRKQIVFFENFVSDEEDIYSGVPQGPNLGPLLFLLYINNIYKLP